jgi:hypothetical protein
MTGYKSPGVHRQTTVLSSSSSAHQIGASTSTLTSAAHHTYGITNTKFNTGSGIGIGSGSRRGSEVGAGIGIGSGTGSRTGSMTGAGTGVGTGTGRKGSAVLSSTTLPEWNNCSDIHDDVALALDFPSSTSPRSKSE